MSKLTIQLDTGFLDLHTGVEKEFFVTKRIHKLEDLETRDSDFAKELYIPRTINNVQQLGLNLPTYRNMFSSTSEPYNCQVLMNGLTIVDDAVLYVVEEDIRNATILIGLFGGSTKFFNLLTDSLISQLDFSEYNLIWDLPTLQTKINTEEGFLYGNSQFIDNDSIETFLSEKDPENTIFLGGLEVDNSGGWFYMKTIFLRILDTIPNLTFDTSFFDDEFLENLVLLLPVTQNADDWESGSEIVRSLVRQDLRKLYPDLLNERFTFDTVDFEEPIGFWNVGQQRFEFTEEATYLVKFHIKGDTRISTKPTTSVVKTSIRHNGVEVASFTHHQPAPNTYYREDHILEVYIAADIGDYIQAWITTDVWASFTVEAFSNPTFEAARLGSNAGRYVEVSDWLPEITQKDFIKEFLKFAHLVPVEEAGVVSFIFWDKIQDEKEQNLTSYLNTKEAITRKGYIPSYSKENIFKYSENDLIERKDTDTILRMDYSLAIKDRVLIESVYLPCDRSEYNKKITKVCSPLFGIEYEHVDDNMIKIAIGGFTFETVNRPHGLEPGDHLYVWDDLASETMKRKVIFVTSDYIGVVDVAWNTNKDETEWDYIKYRKKDIQLQIAIAETPTPAINLTIDDGGLTFTSSINKIIRFPNDLTWGGLANKYYKNYKNNIFRPLVVQAWFNFPLIVYKQINIAQPVYLENERAQFYINEISQYKESGDTRIDLIRLTAIQEKILLGSFQITPIEPVDLGEWTIGDTPLEQIYQIENTGNVDLVIDITFDGTGAQYYEVVGDSSIDVPVLSTIPVTIRFIGGDDKGVQPCEIRFDSDKAFTLIRNITANILVYQYSVEPVGLVDLGAYEGEALTQIYLLTNTGDYALSVAFSLSNQVGSWQLLTISPVAIPVGGSANVEVEYTGDPVAGIKNVTVDFVEVNAGNYARQLIANVQSVSSFTFEPAAQQNLGDWDLGNIPLTQDYLLENVGTEDLTINSSINPNTVGNWSIDLPNPIDLPIGSSKTVVLTFTDSDVGGVNTCNFSMASSSQRVDRSAIVTVVRDTFSFTVQPVDLVDLGDWEYGTEPKLSQVYQVHNNGLRNLAIGVHLGGSNPAMWSIIGSDILIVPVNNTVPTTIQFDGSGVTGHRPADVIFSNADAPNLTRVITAREVVVIKTMTVTPPQIDLGLYQGAPKTGNFTIENTGNVDLLVTLGFLNQNGNWSFGVASPVPVPVGNSVIVPVTYTFTAGDSGVYDTDCVFDAGDGVSDITNIFITVG